MKAVNHLEMGTQVALGEMFKHAGVDQALHKGRSVLRQTERRQPFVPYPLVVHIAERQRCSRGAWG